MLDSKPIYSLIVFWIDFCKNINKLLDEDFARLYQFYVGIYM